MTTVWRFYLCQIGDQSFETIWQNVNACKYLRRLMVDYKSYSNCNSLPKLLLPAATFSFIQGCGSRYRKILDPNPYFKKPGKLGSGYKKGRIRVRIQKKVESESVFRKRSNSDIEKVVSDPYRERSDPNKDPDPYMEKMSDLNMYL